MLDNLLAVGAQLLEDTNFWLGPFPPIFKKLAIANAGKLLLITLIFINSPCAASPLLLLLRCLCDGSFCLVLQLLKGSYYNTRPTRIISLVLFFAIPWTAAV